MEKSTVYVSMNNKNDIGCSYAIIEKGKASIIIIFKDLECAVYDYNAFLKENFDFKYLLLKNYETSSRAYKDFMKLIGKMCKKSEDGKYFKNHVDEDNWIVFTDDDDHHMILEEEKEMFLPRKENFTNFVKNNRDKMRLY